MEKYKYSVHEDVSKTQNIHREWEEISMIKQLMEKLPKTESADLCRLGPDALYSWADNEKAFEEYGKRLPGQPSGVGV